MRRLPIVEALSRRIQKNHFHEGLLFISVGLIAAIVCSFYARLFSLVEHLSVSANKTHPLIVFVLSPLFMVISYLLVKHFAPGSSGSGIPQVITCIEEPARKFTSLFLRKSVIIIKILSSLVAVFAGAAIGREGPSLQISGAIAFQLGKLGERFGIKIRENQLMIAGAASGLAAAFNTPIGGVVYAIEELSKEHVRAFRDILLLSVIIAGLTAQVINGNYLYLGYPKLPPHTSFSVLSLIALCGIISGIMGGIFSKTLLALNKWRAAKKLATQIFIVAAIGLIIAASYYFMGSRSMYSGNETINAILFSDSHIPFYETISRLLMPLLSSMSGVAGGVFAPSLSAGAVIGETLSGLFNPELRNILALSGMVGFLTGVTHTPITSFILVLEMTDRHSSVFPMMIAGLFSSLGAHLISDKSFYEESVNQIKGTATSNENSMASAQP